MRVLVVDDSSMMRKIIVKTLAQLDAETVEAKNGIEALEIARAESDRLSVILLDWNMPEKDGFETLSELKADDATRAIPVMMVTTEAEKANVVKAIQAGACQYLTKPFKEEMLLEKLRKAAR